MSSESDNPSAQGAPSSSARAPRRAPTKASAATTAAKPKTTRAPVKRTTAAKAPVPAEPVDAVVAEATETNAETHAEAPAPKKPAAPRKPVQRKTPAAPRTPATPRTPRTPAKPRTAPVPPPSVVRDLDPSKIALSISGLRKKFGSTTAVDGIDLDVPQGSFYGIVGPNGAGKTTTLSMVTGLLRPDGGVVTVLDQDVWRDPAAAKRLIGVLPDRLRLFDRLTGRQLLYYSGSLRGLDTATVRQRSDDLATAFGLEDALGRLVSDYSAGMTKKIALACAMIHSPRILVLDEPFESVDPVSAANVVDILEKYVTGGGTVVLSSHSMDMIQRVCDRVAIIVEGRVLAKGTVDEVREGGTLEQRFMELAGGRKSPEGMEWLLSSSD
ncbi:ATP-binding cassette domain-containing protein [Herbiconiux liukaitaii]|uniref:ATP-binding cassette domain-containing protein n=1 Tax=Herbiconiux liukaitaii TaxID=3342799 RepID=UPI004044CFAB